MKRRILALALLLALGLGGGAARAQDDCPADRACVDYGTVVLEIDPADGPVQLLIVREETTRRRGIDGADEKTVTLYGALFIQTAPRAYEFEREIGPLEREGIFADAELGDSFGLTNLGSAG